MQIKTKKTIPSLIISILFLAFSYITIGECQVSKNPTLNHTLWGKLPNGMRYVVKQNNIPENRIYFRLILNVGSLAEKPGEEGIAHFIEHLAFRNTMNYPNGGIVKLLESYGEKYGVSINAYTGYDRTIYIYSIPTHIPNAVEIGAKIAYEWLHNIAFADQTVAQEKPIIYEEIAQANAFDCFDKLKKGADTRLHRQPIASKEEVQQIKTSDLVGFYKRNYTPNHAALVVVGHVDTTKTKEIITKTFGSLPSPNNRWEPFIQPLRYDANSRFETCVDERSKIATIECIYPVEAKPTINTAQIIDEEKRNLIIAMLNHRLYQKGSKMRISQQWFLGGTDHLCIEVTGKKDSLLNQNLKQGISIIAGLGKTGLTETECKEQINHWANARKALSFSKSSSEWTDVLTDILLLESRTFLSAKEVAEAKKQLEKLSPKDWHKEINAFLKVLNTVPPLIGYTYSPNLHKECSYKEIRKDIQEAMSMPDTTFTEKKMHDEKPETKIDIAFLQQNLGDGSATITDSAYWANLGVYEYRLNNHARLILKQVKNPDKLVSVNMLFEGGISRIPTDKYNELESVASYMSLGGIEQIDDHQYDTALMKYKLSCINTMEPYWHGIMSTTGTTNLPKLANLIWNRCFHAKRCYTDFNEIKEELKEEYYQNQQTKHNIRLSQQAPDRLLRIRLDELSGNALSKKPDANIEDIKRLDLDSIANFYHSLYTKSEGLNCIVVGEFDKEEAKKLFSALLSRYTMEHDAQSLEANNKQTQNVIKIEGKASERIATHPEQNRVSFDYLFRGSFNGGLKQMLTLKLMREMIRKDVIKIIRNEKGLIYSPYVDLYYHNQPVFQYTMDINGSVDSSKAHMVKAQIKGIINNLAKKKVATAELNALKESFILTKNSTLLHTGLSQWKEYLTTTVKEHVGLNEANDYEKIIKSITPEELLKAFEDLSKAEQNFIYIGDIDEND